LTPITIILSDILVGIIILTIKEEHEHQTIPNNFRVWHNKNYGFQIRPRHQKTLLLLKN